MRKFQETLRWLFWESNRYFFQEKMARKLITNDEATQRNVCWCA